MRSSVISFIKRIHSFITDKQTVLYVVFGLLATVVNWSFFKLFSYILASPTLRDFLATTIAILFAYFTNKIFVFSNRNWSVKHIIPEIVTFFSSRLFAFSVELAIMALMAEILGFNEYFWKLIASVFTMILNYICTRYIFKKKNAK